MDFEYTQHSLELQARLKEFYARHIIPRWRQWQASIKRDNVPEHAFVDELRALATA
mgnify:CR=1 FL=1